MYIVIMAINVFTINREIPICYIEYTNMPFSQRKFYHYQLSQIEEPTSDFHKTVKALGTQYFKWELLDECETEKEAKELVKYYIHEYKADTIGYNKTTDESMSGENHPNFGDHRTFEEKYGKEKADEMKRKQSESLKGNEAISVLAKSRMTISNPQKNPETREKNSQGKLGIKNPKAIYDYVLVKENGEEIVIECIREYCRDHKGFSKTGILQALRQGKKYKGMSVYKKDKV